MRGLAGLDRLLAQRQRLLRENAPRPPVMLDQMLSDALDTSHRYQLPEAPPPPKLPPPPENPPLSLELEPLDHEPPDDPDDQLPPDPAPRPPSWLWRPSPI